MAWWVSAKPKLVMQSLLRCLGGVLLFACPSRAVEESLHRGLAKTPAPLVCALFVVDRHPVIEVGLQGIRGVVDLLAECHSGELIEQCLVEPLAYAVVCGLVTLVLV